MYSLCTCMYNIFCTSIRFPVGLCTTMSEICYAPCILSVSCKVPPLCTLGTMQVGSILVTNKFSCNNFGGILYLPITALSFIMHHFYMYVLYVCSSRRLSQFWSVRHIYLWFYVHHSPSLCRVQHILLYRKPHIYLHTTLYPTSSYAERIIPT
jgi:hypothetical protein